MLTMLDELQMSVQDMVLHNKELVISMQIMEEERQQYKDLLDFALIGYLVTDTSGIIQEANKAAVAMFSTHQDSLVGSCLYDHFPIQIAGMIREKMEGVIRTGQFVHLNDCKVGSYVIRTITPLYDQKNQEIKIIILACNVAQEMAEEVLRESEERYRQLVEFSPDAIVVHTGGKVVYINTAGAILFGLTSAEKLIGRNILDLIHPDDQEFVRMRIKQIEVEGIPTPLREYRIVRFDRKIVDVEARGIGITYRGKPSNLVIIRDITVRKNAERELKTLNEILKKEQKHRKLLSKRLIDLLERDRHEVAMELHDHIGQLLTTIKMDLEIISSELELVKPQLQYRIRSASKKTAYAIIDLKKIAHGLMPDIIKNLGLIPSLRALINNINANSSFTIHFFTENIQERFDMAKELAIYRIAQEALSNIIKHSQAKQVFINLIKKDQVILFGVEDDGIGFKIDEENHISSGEGPLGLHIMRERIVQLGGELTIDSRIGAGTHILVELPL